METIKNAWNGLVEFLSTYDARRIVQAMQDVDWQEQLTNPFAWLVSIVILAYSIWKRDIRFLVLIGSFIGFVVMCEMKLPEPGAPIALDDILAFMGGAIGLIVLNGYFFFIREK